MLSAKQIKLIQKSKNICKECKKFGVSTSTYYRDLEKYRKGGVRNLAPKSRKPKSTQKTSQNIERKIIRLAKTGKYIHASDITKKANSDGISISDSTVRRILRDNNHYGEVLVDEVRDGVNVSLYRVRVLNKPHD